MAKRIAVKLIVLGRGAARLMLRFMTDLSYELRSVKVDEEQWKRCGEGGEGPQVRVRRE